MREKLPFVLMFICLLLLFPFLPLLFLMSSLASSMHNGGSFGQGKLEGPPSGQISLSEGLPWGKVLLKSWPEVSEKEGKGSAGRGEMGRPVVVDLEVGRELT